MSHLLFKWVGFFCVEKAFQVPHFVGASTFDVTSFAGNRPFDPPIHIIWKPLLKTITSSFTTFHSLHYRSLAMFSQSLEQWIQISLLIWRPNNHSSLLKRLRLDLAPLALYLRINIADNFSSTSLPISWSQQHQQDKHQNFLIVSTTSTQSNSVLPILIKLP